MLLYNMLRVYFEVILRNTGSSFEQLLEAVKSKLFLGRN